MRQFDVYANPSQRSKARAPFLIVLPFRHFLERRTTVIAPLVDSSLLAAVSRLNPVFTISDKRVMLSPLELVSVPTAELVQLIANLQEERDAIVGALDLLFTGV